MDQAFTGVSTTEYTPSLYGKASVTASGHTICMGVTNTSTLSGLAGGLDVHFWDVANGGWTSSLFANFFSVGSNCHTPSTTYESIIWDGATKPKGNPTSTTYIWFFGRSDETTNGINNFYFDNVSVTYVTADVETCLNMSSSTENQILAISQDVSYAFVALLIISLILFVDFCRRVIMPKRW